MPEIQPSRCAGCPFSKRAQGDTATFRADHLGAWVKGIDIGSPLWTCHSNPAKLCAGACGVPRGLQHQALRALTVRWGPLEPPGEPFDHEEMPF